MSEERRPIVLVVDDTPDNLKLISDPLKESYTVKIATNGEKALAIAASEVPPTSFSSTFPCRRWTGMKSASD